MKRICLTLLMLCSFVFSWAYDVKIDSVFYNLDQNNLTATVAWTLYKQFYSGNVIIPEAIVYGGKRYPVVSIGNEAFYNCTDLTSVTIPNSVTSIGNNAFRGCSSLTSVAIPNSVTSMGSEAFSGCGSLTSITIPSSVTNIGECAFYGCSSLPVIDNIRYADTYLVETVDKTLSSYKIKEGTRFIGTSAFSGCNNLTSVTIPNSVPTIGQKTFYGCSSLTSITIPNSVTSVGESAFYGCSSLTSITIPNNVTSIGKSAFCKCSSLTSASIPNGVTTIGAAAFEDCTSLTSVTIPNNVTSIGQFAFYGCSSLTSITIPNSVTSIGGSAFSGCSSLTSITIPNSVMSIGLWAFSGCRRLTSPVYNAHVFAYLPTSYTGEYVIPDGIKSIAPGAFSGCSGLTSITIPNGVTQITTNTFRDCTHLTSVTIPNSVTSIRTLAFFGCSRLASITIPNSVTSIEYEAFLNCRSLTSIAIPNSVTSISSIAFRNCSNLTSIRVDQGNTVYDSRNNCNAIIETVTNKLIIGCKNTVIPNTVMSIGQHALEYCTGLTSITIPNSVTSIGEGAFNGCGSLTSINIPNSVTSIGRSAFYNVPNIIYSGTATGAPWGARSLNGYVEGYLVYRDTTKTELLTCSAAATGEITLPNSVQSMGQNAFDNCSNLKAIFVPCGELERFTQMFNDSYNSDYSDKLKIASSPHTLTIKDTKYGSVSVPDYNGCDESVMITAIPDPHCRFVKWSDGNTDNPRPVYLTEDITLEALFVYTLTDKCGKDYLLTWTLDTLKMAMDITGKGSLSDNYTYHTTFATLTIGNEVTTIGANAFSDCDNLQYLTLGSSVRVIESGAFACSDIKTITCYNKRPPTVNNDAFCNLDYETIIYVPKDYLENYQMHAFWGMFDVRPIGASGTETDKVKVEPSETTATVAWPTISGAGSYELVIRDKDGNALCTLVFNAQGQLTSIDFAAAPARDRSNVAAMAQGAGFAFTVTGLESGTMYKYSFITKNASGTVIDTKTGAFTTQSPTALEDIMDNASSSSSVRKVLQNGQLYILRDDKVYNAVGAEVKL